MARLPRFYLEDQPQHIIQRGNNRENIFLQAKDYVFYLECLLDAVNRYQINIHAYVLMTNHVHLLASPQIESSIPKTLQSVGRKYVQYFNRKYKRTGTLWEGRYKATPIDSEIYLLKCMRYIELNPVRAKMVRHPKNYRWSSYKRNALGESDALITSHVLYKNLGKSVSKCQSAYGILFNETLPAGVIDTIRHSTNKAWPLGDKNFAHKIEELTKRRCLPKPKGRPKKVESDPKQKKIRKSI